MRGERKLENKILEDISKKEIIGEVLEKTKYEENKIEKTSKYFWNNSATIISLITILLFLIVYAYDCGFYKAYNIDLDCIEVEITDFLPVAMKLCGMCIYIVFYLVQISKDKIIKKQSINLLRIIYGAYILNYIALGANVDNLIGGVTLLIMVFLISLLVEILWWKNSKRKADRKYNSEEKQSIIEGMIEDRIFYLIYNRYMLGIAVSIVLFASLWGGLSAKAKNEYQIFESEEVKYAVIIDRKDYIIAEKVTEEEDRLFINGASYTFFSKENKAFRIKEYSCVEIEGKK